MQLDHLYQHRLSLSLEYQMFSNSDMHPTTVQWCAAIPKRSIPINPLLILIHRDRVDSSFIQVLTPKPLFWPPYRSINIEICIISQSETVPPTSCSIYPIYFIDQVWMDSCTRMETLYLRYMRRKRKFRSLWVRCPSFSVVMSLFRIYVLAHDLVKSEGVYCPFRCCTEHT